MRTSWAFASWACSALLLAGCGGPSLEASGLRAGMGLLDAPDRRTGGSAEPVPTWRVESGGRVTYSVQLRNTGDDPVRVVGVERDEDGDDQQFAPGGIGPQPRLAPGAAARVEVTGRHDCDGRTAGQVSGKNGQRFRLDGGETVDVDLGGLIEFACPR